MYQLCLCVINLSEASIYIYYGLFKSLSQTYLPNFSKNEKNLITVKIFKALECLRYQTFSKIQDSEKLNMAINYKESIQITNTCLWIENIINFDAITNKLIIKRNLLKSLMNKNIWKRPEVFSSSPTHNVYYLLTLWQYLIWEDSLSSLLSLIFLFKVHLLFK